MRIRRCRPLLPTTAAFLATAASAAGSLPQLLLSKPMDLKSAMQAISNGGSQEMAKLLLKAMKEQQIKEHRPERACVLGLCGVCAELRQAVVAVMLERISTCWQLAEQSGHIAGQCLAVQKLGGT